MSESRTYVIGHRNPDTDSICSAIAYAELRRRQGLKGVRPARAGTLNRQTQFILDHLEVDSPELLSDVYPRIRDVVTETVVSIHQSAPLVEAIELYNRHNIRLLPVVDDQQRATGVLMLKQATEHFLVPVEADRMRRVKLSVASLIRCLKADVLTQADDNRVREYNLFVGARREETFKQWMAGTDPEQTILITGDRPGIQRMAVEAGVRVLVLSGRAKVDEALLQEARKQGVTILSCDYDTANSVWLTRMATPVSELVDADFMSVKPTDLIDDLRLKLSHSKQAGALVCNAEGQVQGVATKSHLIKSSPVKLILVDHNELTQAVPGADKVEICEVIDHHRLGNFHTDLPIRFINQPLGSTCSLVATLYQQAGLEPDKKVAGLMLAGLMSDTVILKSPTATEIDRQLVPWLEKLSGLEHEKFGGQLFAAGSPMASGVPARKLITTDFKEYTVNGHILALGQVEVVNFHSFYQRQQELQDELKKLREEKGYELAALLVTDIVMETSLLVTAGPAELPYVIGYPQQADDLYLLKGVLSRKKQLVPHLSKVFKAKG